MIEARTHLLQLNVGGRGTALKLIEGMSTFGLTGVEVPAPATVMWVPDPDNEANTIFWVRNVPGVDGRSPEGTVTLTLTYTGE